MASLGGDEIELALALELEVALDGDQVVVVGAELLDGRQRTRRIFSNAPVSQSHRTPCAIIQRAALHEPAHYFGECLLSLPPHAHVHRRLADAVCRKHRGMPSAPDDGQIGTRSLRGARYPQRIRDRSARKDGDTQAKSALRMPDHCCLCVRVQPRIHNDDFVALGVELGTNRQQRQRHRVEHCLRIVENDLVAAHAAISPRLRIQTRSSTMEDDPKMRASSWSSIFSRSSTTRAAQRPCGETEFM